MSEYRRNHGAARRAGAEAEEMAQAERMAQLIEILVQVRAPEGVGICLPLNLWSSICVPAPAGTINLYPFAQNTICRPSATTERFRAALDSGFV
jgi:hypothetical protein